MRFYRIREYILFLGDEGRDALIVKRMIVDHVYTLLGPITSVGSMYMGPIYYYFMAPFLWVWHLDPVGPSIMVALFSLSTIYLIYRLSYEYFSPHIGIIASLFYAISPLTVIYGRSSWNPNIVPFFSLLIIYCLMKVVIDNNHRWLIVAGFILGILVQLHYVTLLMIPVIIFCLALIKFKIKLKYYICSFLAFITTYSPFLL
ncbi:glycosyltransferase family 39 protein, partial [Candidatus Gottesmanbacteria bacterium]|nr:glycosyltransferase family 39 protein [Candidatus Gottesmanbacteria bacterium]